MKDKLTKTYVEKESQGKEIGNSDDTRCRQSNFKLMGISDCKNNCKQNKFNSATGKKECVLGYRK